MSWSSVRHGKNNQVFLFIKDATAIDLGPVKDFCSSRHGDHVINIRCEKEGKAVKINRFMSGKSAPEFANCNSLETFKTQLEKFLTESNDANQDASSRSAAVNKTTPTGSNTLRSTRSTPSGTPRNSASSTSVTPDPDNSREERVSTGEASTPAASTKRDKRTARKRRLRDLDAETIQTLAQEDILSPLQRRFEECKVGTFTVPVGQLATPRKKKLLIRNIDGKAVDALKEKIIQHPNGFYSRIPVIAPELRSKEDFKEEDLPLLRLETLGNNHLRRASQELVLDKRYADCSFIANREVTIYAGLTDDEAVSLAVQHQLDQNRTHSLSFMDKVKLCRKHFSGFKGISETEIGIEDTVVPNEFKASMCDLLEEQYSRDNPKTFNRLGALWFATKLPKDVFEKLEEVSDKFSRSELAGQRKSKNSSLSPDCLSSKEGLGSYTVERLQGNLSNPVRLQLLTEVANKSLSLQEMYNKAKRIKQLQQLRLLIKTYLHVETFEKALELHPNVLHESKLEKYLAYSLNTLPTELKDKLDVFRPPQANIGNGSDETTIIRFPSPDNLGPDVTLTVFSLGLELSANIVRAEDHLKEFPGASLCIVEVEEHWTEEQIAAIGAFLNAVNFRIRLRGYSVVVLCTLNNIGKIQHYIKIVCPYIESAFYYAKDKRDRDPNALTETVTPIVIGHWLRDKPSSGPRGCWEPDDCRHNLWSFPEGKPVSLYRHVISHYSQPSDYVMIVHNTNGSALKAAVSLGRNCIFTESNGFLRDGVLNEMRAYKEEIEEDQHQNANNLAALNSNVD